MTRLSAFRASVGAAQSRRTKLLKMILPVRTYKASRLALQRMLLRAIEGDSTSLSPGPPVLIAEQPTYAPVRVYAQPEDPPVRIGRYCSINETVTLVPGSEHPLDAVTTCYFYWMMGEGEPEPSISRGPIMIGSDVWIGRDALVMSGVTISHGAAVASRAVVTKDVAPYEIVGGVPARHIGWRFDEQTREELLKIAWWAWPVEKVLAHRTQLYGRGDAVVDFIARHGGKVDAMTSALHCEVCNPDGDA
jgi:acetyltransferase-like isoleucine patch superfamily enzyme